MESTAKKPVIMAVDDSPTILHTVSSVLTSEYKVLTLSKPAELERILQNVTPDLFLLDYKMPEIDGFELMQIIKSFPKHENTPIIFLTTEGTIDHLTAAISLGASDFVVKPFEPEILRQKIANLL